MKHFMSVSQFGGSGEMFLGWDVVATVEVAS
jgi:hypothetical protein